MLIARTDARSVHDIDEAIRRGTAYVEAGADVIFVEAPRTVEELDAGRPRAGRRPAASSTSSRAARPRSSSVKEYADLGFGVVLFANYLMRVDDARRPRGARAPGRATARPARAPTGWPTWERAPDALQPAAVHRRGGAASTSRGPLTGRRSDAPGLPYSTELPDRVGVLVLGGGLAGCAALLAAAEAGAVRRAAGEDGRDRRLAPCESAGLSAFAGTDEQRGAGHRRLRRAAAQGPARDRPAPQRRGAGRPLLRPPARDLPVAHGPRGRSTARCTPPPASRAPRSHPTDTTAHAASRCSRRPVGSAPGWCSTPRPRRLVREGGRVVGVDVDRRRRAAPRPRRRRRARDRRLLPEPRAARALRAADGARAARRRCRLRGRRPADGLAARRRRRATCPTSRAPTASIHEPHPDEDGTGILAVYKGAIAVNRDGQPVRRRVPALQGDRRRQPRAARRDAPSRSSTGG